MLDYSAIALRMRQVSIACPNQWHLQQRLYWQAEHRPLAAGAGEQVEGQRFERLQVPRQLVSAELDQEQRL